VIAMLAALQAMPQPSPLPSPSPTVSASPTPAPVVTPTPAPVVTPTPAPSPSPLPAPEPLPTPLVLAPDAAPQILAVRISDPVLHSGDRVTGTVITSTNVAAVELRIRNMVLRFQRVDFGIWQLSYVVPHVPRTMHRDFTAQIVAMNTAGDKTSRPLALSLR
jgi:hypothetical protein